MFRLAALFLIALSLASNAQGQLLRRQQYSPSFLSGKCPGGQCPSNHCPSCPPLVVQLPVPVAQPIPAAAQDWFKVLRAPGGHSLSASEEATIRSWTKRAVRILSGNTCGTGSLCGRDSGGIYILTNAHVASSRVGNIVQCEALLADGSGTETFPARVIESAYSNKTSTDWALLKADPSRMRGIEPILLSTEEPDRDALTGTWGCPRCEVPSGQLCKTLQLGSIWYWQPNSIGGQSGSAVIQGGVQCGLLTWTISGNGAGQKTATIYRQSSQQNTDGPARVDGMEIPSAAPGVELTEGYQRETSSINSYPIWAGRNPPSDKPDQPTPQPDLAETRLRQLLGQDWSEFIALALRLAQLLGK